MPDRIHKQGPGMRTLCGLIIHPMLQTTYGDEPPSCIVCRADMIAEKAHLNQMDKGGQPYIEHPRRVSNYVFKSMGTPEYTVEQRNTALAVAILHDTVEDKRLTLGDLMGLPSEVWMAVDIVSRKGETYREFIKRIATSGNRLAILVKLADLQDNMDGTRPTQDEAFRASWAEMVEKRYKPAKAVLERALKETK